MKLCFLSFEYPPEIIGGMGTYAQHLIQGLKDREVEVSVITKSDKNSYSDNIYRIYVPDVLYWRRLFFITDAVKTFHHLNKRYKFDLIHLNGTYPIFKGLKIPMLSTLHSIPNIKQAFFGLRFIKNIKSPKDISYLTLKNPIGSIFDFTTIKFSDKIICPSPALARDIMLYCFAEKNKIQVINNGIDLKTFDLTDCHDTSILKSYGLQKENFILYVGRLTVLKGVQYLIEAFKIVKKQHPNLKLVIVGSGDFEHQLKNIAHGVDGIHFLGYIESLKIKKLLYTSSVAVILPSSAYEVLPMTILEAMASYTTVIASDIEGNSYLIKHGQNGFLSEPNNPLNLAELINMLIEDRNLRLKIGLCGRKLVEEKFTMKMMINKTIKTYESLMT